MKINGTAIRCEGVKRQGRVEVREGAVYKADAAQGI